MLGYGVVSLRSWINPDGNISSTADRVQIGTFYPGINPSGGVVETGTETLLIRRRRH